MAHVSQVPVEDVDCDEQSLNLVLLFHVEVEDLLHRIAAIELGHQVLLLLLGQ